MAWVRGGGQGSGPENHHLGKLHTLHILSHVWHQQKSGMVCSGQNGASVKRFAQTAYWTCTEGTTGTIKNILKGSLKSLTKEIVGMTRRKGKYTL